MNLADMLCYADIQELSRIARHYECECSSHSKHELIQAILAATSRKEAFEARLRDLEEADIRFLNVLLFERRDTFSLEELMARASQSKEGAEGRTEGSPRELISRFKQRAWLFNGHSHDTKALFRVPEDLKRRFSDTLGRIFERRLVYPHEPPPVYREELDLMSMDLLTILQRVGEQELKLNPEGFLYKRHLHQLLECLAVREEPPAKATWRFGYGRRYKEYPARFSYLYDYLYYQGCLEEKDDRLILTEAGAQWLAKQKKEPLSSLYAFWLRLYRTPVPNLGSLLYWVNRLTPQWTALPGLTEVMASLLKPYYYDSPPSIWEQRLLPMLLHLGLIRIGAEERYGGLVQMTEQGSALVRGVAFPEEPLEVDTH